MSKQIQIFITVKLKCKPDRMHIYGASLKMFSGTLMTKNDKIVSCERKFFNVHEFDAEMPYNECGMQKTVRIYCLKSQYFNSKFFFEVFCLHFAVSFFIHLLTILPLKKKKVNGKRKNKKNEEISNINIIPFSFPLI